MREDHGMNTVLACRAQKKKEIKLFSWKFPTNVNRILAVGEMTFSRQGWQSQCCQAWYNVDSGQNNQKNKRK
jgi:hypothetical protein